MSIKALLKGRALSKTDYHTEEDTDDKDDMDDAQKLKNQQRMPLRYLFGHT